MDREIAAGYKKTEVGVIPNDWEVRKIKDLVLITTGSKNTQDKIDDGEYPFFVRSQTVERINSYSFEGEAILTAGDGVGTGKIFHYINGKFDFHQRVYKISHFSEQLDGYYFFLYFSNNFYNRIMQMTAKSSVDSVRMEMIADMPISLPPTKTEQTAIASALSDVDALISGLDNTLAKKRLIKQGTMQELLTGKKRLAGFSGEWEVKKLGDVGECIIGLTYSPQDVKASGLLVLRSSNISSNKLKFDDNVFVDIPVSDKLITKKGDILICVRNGSRKLIGKCALIEEKGENETFGAFMSLYRTEYSKFIFHVFQSNIIKKQIDENMGA